MNKIISKKKYLILLTTIIVAIVALVSFSACNQANNKIQVQDAFGVTKTFDKPQTRLVGSHNPTLNSVVAVGGGGKYLCGFGFKEKADGLYSEVIENWDQLKTVYNNHDFDMDAIRSMNAELAILPESQSKREAEFKEAGVESFFVQPRHESLEVVKETIRKIGILVDDKPRAELLINTFDEIINDAKAKIADCKSDQTIIFTGQNINEVVPTEMIQNNIIEEAGGINAAVEYDKNNDDVKFESGQYAKIDLKTFAEINPNIIVIPNYAKFSIADVYNSPELANTKAVVNKQVYVFPSKLEPWDYSTLSCCLGICCAANALYPEKYTSSDMQNACDKFYSTLYNKTFSAEKLGINW